MFSLKFVCDMKGWTEIKSLSVMLTRMVLFCSGIHDYIGGCTSMLTYYFYLLKRFVTNKPMTFLRLLCYSQVQFKELHEHKFEEFSSPRNSWRKNRKGMRKDEKIPFRMSHQKYTNLLPSQQVTSLYFYKFTKKIIVSLKTVLKGNVFLFILSCYQQPWYWQTSLVRNILPIFCIANVKDLSVNKPSFLPWI